MKPNILQNRNGQPGSIKARRALCRVIRSRLQLAFGRAELPGRPWFHSASVIVFFFNLILSLSVLLPLVCTARYDGCSVLFTLCFPWVHRVLIFANSWWSWTLICFFWCSKQYSKFFFFCRSCSHGVNGNFIYFNQPYLHKASEIAILLTTEVQIPLIAKV